MSDSEEDELDEFERQLKFEQLEKERRSKCSKIEHGATRVDPDGTVYEWDADKMAYFPKIDAEFIAQYQLNYGEPAAKPSETSNENASSTTATTTSSATSTTTVKKTTPPLSMMTSSASEWTEYFAYAQSYIAEHGDYPPGMTQVHKNYYVYYYNYYYGNKAKQSAANKSQGDKEPPSKPDDKKQSSEQKEGEAEKEESSDSEKKDETAEEKSYREYYEYYGDYYKQQQENAGDAESDEQGEFDQWAWYNYYYGDSNQGEGEEEGNEQDKKDEQTTEGESKEAKKRKAKDANPAGWFDVDESKNTNVYVAGLPNDVTDEEYEALMTKCGMVMLDPRTRRLKLKLYRDAEGKPKGDGLCCYIKPESVELALQVLDEYDVRGFKISVERARFQMKGTFDPKKRKKLSNREKKKIRQHQEKLLDWRPDKPKGYRAKNEKIIVIKNAFDPSQFVGDPAKIQLLREEIRAQCLNFGTVKKVIIYDRHQEGVVTVGFAEADEADQGKESLHGRYFQMRQINVETWDGKTKYEVQETEEEKQARLKQWGQFLETGGEKTAAVGNAAAVTEGSIGSQTKTLPSGEQQDSRSADPQNTESKLDASSL